MTDKSETTQIWGTDGGHVGHFTIDRRGGKDMAVIQAQITVCGAKNFDFWWHHVLAQFRDAMEQLEEPQETSADSPPAAEVTPEAEQNFRQRYEKDNCDDMTEEQWGKWVDALPKDEFLAMIAVGGRKHKP